MKSILFAAFVFLSANSAQAETRIVGAVAQELYSSLNITETPVADEHGGSVQAFAKYGKTFGCQRDLTSSKFECWLN